MDDAAERVFLLRVWTEVREVAAQPAVGRGRITDVITGESRHVKNVDELVRFLNDALTAAGLDPLDWDRQRPR